MRAWIPAHSCVCTLCFSSLLLGQKEDAKKSLEDHVACPPRTPARVSWSRAPSGHASGVGVSLVSSLLHRGPPPWGYVGRCVKQEHAGNMFKNGCGQAAEVHHIARNKRDPFFHTPNLLYTHASREGGWGHFPLRTSTTLRVLPRLPTDNAIYP
jgi:hypothetical protein